MWQEARKQEKKVRSMIVDYRKRAERRREFYEKFKADPTQCLQLHGRPCKVYMDPTITTAADESLMQWQGNKETIIDRFDVRAHLDYIPDVGQGTGSPVTLDKDVESLGELNYERYRILVQNELTNLSEDKFLHQIHIEEQFGTVTGAKEGKAAKTAPKAAIGYNYETSVVPDTSYGYAGGEGANEEDSDEDLDFDLLVNLNDLNTLQKMELNTSGTKYGMREADFMTFLTKDVKEREHLKLLKVQEEEKQQMSGRKARRERRAYKDRQLSRRENYSPPSYATSTEPNPEPIAKRRSSSRSHSSDSEERITYITSFGPKPDGNSIFGPNLPNSYKRKTESSRSRRNRDSRSASPRRRRDRRRRSRTDSRDRSSKRYNRSRHRHRSSSSSSSSSSGSSSSGRKRSKKSSYNTKKRKDRKSSSRSESSSGSRSKQHSQRSASRDVEGGIENLTTSTRSKGEAEAGRSAALTPQERLKRRMQLALNKQLKCDKESERLRAERLEQERLEREESLREIAIRHRRRERERRHGHSEHTSDSSRSRSRSRSTSPA